MSLIDFLGVTWLLDSMERRFLIAASHSAMKAAKSFIDNGLQERQRIIGGDQARNLARDSLQVFGE
jgi:hypothetical protein